MPAYLTAAYVIGLYHAKLFHSTYVLLVIKVFLKIFLQLISDNEDECCKLI